jgi:hypothetical protein
MASEQEDLVDPRSSPGNTQPSDGSAEDDIAAAARLEILTEENRRLRKEYARARTSEYRRTALGLAAVGAVALVGALLIPDGREVLVAFGMTGLFGAVLTRYLTPTQFVAADAGERVYAAMAANSSAIAAQLAIDGEHRYVPGTDRPAYLYVPQADEATIPDHGDGPLVTDPNERGLFLEATGAFLFEEFRRALTGDLAAEPRTLATQLSDGVVEQFEFADAIDQDIEPADGRITFRVSGSAFGAIDRFDHPLASFLGSGLAAGLDSPVSLDVEPAEEYADWLLTYRWSTEEK